MKSGDKRETLLSIQASVRRERVTLGKARREQVLMTKHRLGHCGLATGLFLFGKHEDGLCDCSSAKNCNNVIMDCRKYTRERKEMYGEGGGARGVLTGFIGIWGP